jgi:hypothetical protein
MTLIRLRDKIVNAQKSETKDVIEELHKRNNNYNLIRNYKLSEEFIHTHLLHKHARWISKYQNLSEQFIITNIDQLDPLYLLRYQKNLSETVKLLLTIKNL